MSKGSERPLIELGKADITERFDELKRVIYWDYESVISLILALKEQTDTISKTMDEIKEAAACTK